MAGEEQKLNPSDNGGQQPPKDAGAEARANDIIDALVEIHAWQDGERKADQEAQQLEK